MAFLSHHPALGTGRQFRQNMAIKLVKATCMFMIGLGDMFKGIDAMVIT